MDFRDYPANPITATLQTDTTRRELLAQAMAWGALAAIATRPIAARAQANEAIPALDAGLTELVSLSQALTGGKVDEARAEMLHQFLRADPELSVGLDQLIASPPVSGTPIATGSASATATVILTYWYAGSLNGNPVADRAAAYYQLTAWQAMYTFPGSVCRGFGAWADEPASAPLVPGD